VHWGNLVVFFSSFTSSFPFPSYSFRPRTDGSYQVYNNLASSPAAYDRPSIDILYPHRAWIVRCCSVPLTSYLTLPYLACLGVRTQQTVRLVINIPTGVAIEKTTTHEQPRRQETLSEKIPPRPQQVRACMHACRRASRQTSNPVFLHSLF
jgi:hypothetical protein